MLPMHFADVSPPTLTAGHPSWLFMWAGKWKAALFKWTLAVLMPFTIFIWAKQSTKVNPAAIIISICYKPIQALKHLQDDWHFQAWNIHSLITFHCKLIFQFSSAVITLFFFFFMTFPPLFSYLLPRVGTFREKILVWKLFLPTLWKLFSPEYCH